MGHFDGKKWQCACAVSRDRVVGVIQNHIFGSSDSNLPVHYITFMGPQRRLREFTWEHPIAKRFAAENFPSPVKRGLQNGGFRKLRGLNVNFFVF